MKLPEYLDRFQEYRDLVSPKVRGITKILSNTIKEGLLKPSEITATSIRALLEFLSICNENKKPIKLKGGIPSAYTAPIRLSICCKIGLFTTVIDKPKYALCSEIIKSDLDVLRKHRIYMSTEVRDHFDYTQNLGIIFIDTKQGVLCRSRLLEDKIRREGPLEALGELLIKAEIPGKGSTVLPTIGSLLILNEFFKAPVTDEELKEKPDDGKHPILYEFYKDKGLWDWFTKRFRRYYFDSSLIDEFVIENKRYYGPYALIRRVEKLSKEIEGLKVIEDIDSGGLIGTILKLVGRSRYFNINEIQKEIEKIVPKNVRNLISGTELQMLTNQLIERELLLIVGDGVVTTFWDAALLIGRQMEKDMKAYLSYLISMERFRKRIKDIAKVLEEPIYEIDNKVCKVFRNHIERGIYEVDPEEFTNKAFGTTKIRVYMYVTTAFQELSGAGLLEEMEGLRFRIREPDVFQRVILNIYDEEPIKELE